MPLNKDNRLAVFATAAEAVRRTWVLKVPLVILVYLIALPWNGVTVARLGGWLIELMRLVPDSLSGSFPAYAAYIFLAVFTYGTWALFWLGGTVLIVLLALMWYRYLLLGRATALKFGPGQFKCAFWRMVRYAVPVAVLFAAINLLNFTYLSRWIYGLSREAALGPYLTNGMAWVAYAVCAYFLPLVLLIRFSFSTSAAALDQRFSLRDSWSSTRGSTWRLILAIITVAAPSMFLWFSLQHGWSIAVRLIPRDLRTEYISGNFWIIEWAVSPVAFLPATLAMAVVAIAYRDLSNRHAAAPALGAHYAT